MESLASADLAISDITRETRSTIDRLGVYKTSELRRMERNLRLAQEKMNIDARSISQIMENSDITKGVGREEYLRAVNRSEMGKEEYRTARNTYFNANRANDVTIGNRGKELREEAMRIVPLEFESAEGAAVVARNKAQRLAVGDAVTKLREDRKRVDAKYPPV